jgi:putative ABC transport system ATP-binding protein
MAINEQSAQSGHAVASLRRVTKDFNVGGRRFSALSAVDLQLDAGETVAIIGRSGSGKSTLLNMITGIDRPSSGTVTVAGVELSKLSESEVASVRGKLIGIVFQFFQLIPTLSARENVLLAMELVDRISPLEREARAQRLLAQVGLEARADQLPGCLSGGEQQRAAIARALANDPPVILADEPTANLDSAIGRQVARLLRQLATEDGRAVVIVSHDARLEEIADRVLWLEDGSFRELATMATDPVCGMTVARHDTPHVQLNGTLWWFCSTGCRDEFAASPTGFTSQPSPGQTGAWDEPQRLRRHQPTPGITNERPGADPSTREHG